MLVFPSHVRLHSIDAVTYLDEEHREIVMVDRDNQGLVGSEPGVAAKAK
jgi:hypothetical protein